MRKCRLLLFIFIQFMVVPAFAQNPADPALPLLLGRWEVVAYSEQGIPVDKKQPALPQAAAIYPQIRPERARNFYGYSQYEDYSRRESRDYGQWAERDSAVEVARLTEAIALPYFAVFFADSTLAVYNKNTTTHQVSSPEAKHFAFSPVSMSLDIIPANQLTYERWQAQILLLTATRLTLFLPETAEVVELIKTPFILP